MGHAATHRQCEHGHIFGVCRAVRRLIALPVLALLWGLCAQAQAAEPIQACFTPGEDCTGLIVEQIGAAKSEVLVQAYSFTSPEIVKALLQAKRRGVDVQAILDKSNVCKDAGECEKKGAIAADTLSSAKIPMLIDRAHAIAHNKVMVIDRSVVITGSFNFTRAAQEKNAENLLVIREQGLAERYLENWTSHSRHADLMR